MSNAGPLTHLDASGAARMVDVSGKEPGVRRAVATGVLRTTEEVVRLLRAEQLPKGDALATARRTPGSLPETSTIRAAPEASRWVLSLIHISEPTRPY